MRLGDLDALSAFVGDLRSTLHKEQAEFNAMTQSEFEIKDSMLLSFQYAIDNAPIVEIATELQQFATICNKRKASVELAYTVTPKIRNVIAVDKKDRVVCFLLVMITSASFTRKAVRKMTNKEALKAWKNLYSEIDKENWLFMWSKRPYICEDCMQAFATYLQIKLEGGTE